MKNPDLLVKRAWRLVLAAVGLYGAVAFFHWSLVDVVSVFFAWLPWAPVGILALAAMVAAIRLAYRRWRIRPGAALLPLAFLVMGIGAMQFVDFTELWLTANFQYRRAEREEVVRQIESGELQPSAFRPAFSVAALPGPLAATSLGGGEVMVQRDGATLRIFFYTFRGVLDRFAGFVYSSDGTAPKNGDFAGRFFINRQIGDRWYYVSAH